MEHGSPVLDASTRIAGIWIAAPSIGMLVLSGCQSMPAPTPDPRSQLIAKGRDVFLKETFNAGTEGPAGRAIPRRMS
jgi:hypothetical protein